MKRAIIVCGTRTLSLSRYRQAVFDWLNHLTKGWRDFLVITGGADGADYLGNEWAKANGHRREGVYADWDKYNKAAGPIRNRKMAHLAELAAGRRYCVAFWDGVSAGTKDMIAVARRNGFKVKVIRL